MKHLGWILLGFAAILVVFGGNERRADAPAAEPRGGTTAARTPAAPVAHRFRNEPIVVQRDPSGQFHLELAVNGNPVRFLVDTGADTVALTETDARRAGLIVDPATFQPILRTASGEGLGTRVRLERLEIGDTEVHDVEAVVVRDLDVSLLGQTALGRLARVELQRDRMVLQPAD